MLNVLPTPFTCFSIPHIVWQKCQVNESKNLTYVIPNPQDPDPISNLFGISDYIRRYTITYPNLPNNNFPVGNSRFVVIPNLPHNITKQADSSGLVWQLPNNKITDVEPPLQIWICQTIFPDVQTSVGVWQMPNNIMD